MKRNQDAAAGGGDFLRVLLSQNVSGPYLTESEDRRTAKAVYTWGLGLARGGKKGRWQAPHGRCITIYQGFS